MLRVGGSFSICLPVAKTPPRRVGDALGDPFVEERELVERLPHPLVGSVPNLRSPLRMSETPLKAASAPPMLAQHTNEVLETVLNYDTDKIAALRGSGAVA